MKLGGFDLAAELPPARPSLSEVCGALGFTAPEVLAGSPYDCLADVYSFGCLMARGAGSVLQPVSVRLSDNMAAPGRRWCLVFIAMPSSLSKQSIICLSSEKLLLCGLPATQNPKSLSSKKLTSLSSKKIT